MEEKPRIYFETVTMTADDELVLCDTCKGDVADTVHIKCAVCPAVRLCLECFAEGAELRGEKEHENDHDYHVIDVVTQPLFDEEWRADEELLLLDAILDKGLGNWIDAAEYVGGNKSKTKCEAHYHAVYLNSPTAPLPHLDGPMLNPSTYPMDATDYNAYASMNLNPPKSKGKLLPEAEMATFRQKRKEFDHEWKNEAEESIAEIDFTVEDSELETEVKFKLIEAYNRILNERYERKAFVLQNDLMYERMAKKAGALGISPEVDPVSLMLKPFLRVQSVESHQRTVTNIFTELKVRKRIERLQQYRMHGIRTILEEKAYLDALKSGDIVNNKVDLSGSRGGRTIVWSPDTLASMSNGSFCIAQMQSVELLSKSEMALCLTEKILPRLYLYMKWKMTSESFANSFLTQDQAIALFPYDQTLAISVYNFMVKNKWVNDRPVPHHSTPHLSNSLSNPQKRSKHS